MSVPADRAPATRSVAVLGLLLVGAYLVAVSRASQVLEYDTWGALVVIPVLLLVSVPLLLRAGRADPDPRFLSLLVTAFVLKGLATAARYWMAFVFYEGVADANGYDGHGARLAESYRAGDFGADVGMDLIGTGFIRVLTGIVYTVTGPSVYVAYAVFAWLGFWGLYFFYRAFRTAVPEGDHHRYAILVLFLPSMLFWPSGLGKEAWMTFGLGLAAFGAARLLVGERGWVLPLAGGLVATAMVRPHVTAIFFAGVAAAVVLRPALRTSTPLTPLARAATILAVAGVAFLIAGRAASFLGVEELSFDGIDAAVSDTGDSTSQGGSEFDASPVTSALQLPMAAVTVVYRPFVIEADNAQTLLAAAEGTLLLLLTALALPRLRGLANRLRRQPYLVLCMSYALMFVYAFSHFSNFGILTRQRVQVLPFVLVLLALPLVRHGGRRRSVQLSHQEVSP